jgi:hypothetical protein
MAPLWMQTVGAAFFAAVFTYHWIKDRDRWSGVVALLLTAVTIFNLVEWIGE